MGGEGPSVYLLLIMPHKSLLAFLLSCWFCLEYKDKNGKSVVLW